MAPDAEQRLAFLVLRLDIAPELAAGIAVEHHDIVRLRQPDQNLRLKNGKRRLSKEVDCLWLFGRGVVLDTVIQLPQRQPLAVLLELPLLAPKRTRQRGFCFGGLALPQVV